MGARSVTQERGEEHLWRIDADQLELARGHAIELSNRLLHAPSPHTVDKDLEVLVDEAKDLVGPTAIVSPFLAASLSDCAVQLAKANGRLDDPEALDNANLSLQSVIQVLDLLSEGVPAITADLNPKMAARWLMTALAPATQAEVAGIIGVGERALQHWIAPNEQSAPHGSNRERLRRLLILSGRLLPMFTSQGFVDWLKTPLPVLGRSPGEALDTDEGFSEVMRIAAQLRGI